MSMRRLLAAVVVCTGLIVLDHAAASAQMNPLFAVLLGGNEVSNPGGDANAGDLNAYGGVTMIFRGIDTICFGIVVANLDTPTAAHIHSGKAGVNGGILVNLGAPDGGNPGSTSNCITDPSPAFVDAVRAIKNNPALFYVNVHSIAFPNGGLRGQLF
jgi:CHRD domain-containing protein